MSITVLTPGLKEKLLNASGVQVPSIVEKSPYVRDKTEYARMTGAQEVLDFWQKLYEDGTIIIPQDLEKRSALYNEIDTDFKNKGGEGIEALINENITIVRYSPKLNNHQLP